MKIVCLLHSLLKKIQEWMAVSASGRERPTDRRAVRGGEFDDLSQ
jgi:hypothetical protein